MRTLCSKALQKSQNYYGVLKLENNVANDLLKRRYTEMSRSIEITVKNLSYKQNLFNEAFQTLSNRTKRVEYDLKQTKKLARQ